MHRCNLIALIFPQYIKLCVINIQITSSSRKWIFSNYFSFPFTPSTRNCVLTQPSYDFKTIRAFKLQQSVMIHPVQCCNRIQYINRYNISYGNYLFESKNATLAEVTKGATKLLLLLTRHTLHFFDLIFFHSMWNLFKRLDIGEKR